MGARSFSSWVGGRVRRWPHIISLLFAILFVAVALVSMAYFVPEKLRDAALKIKNDANLVAQLLPATLPEPSKVDSAYWLPQNWTSRQRYWFHHTSQGTATIPVPYRWFLALERPELSIHYTSLTDDEYLRRLGFIPSPSSKGFASKAAAYGYHEDASQDASSTWTPSTPDNPNGLPVGFAILKGGVDPTTGALYEDQIGLTCAACHTGHLEYKNVSIRYDGGPAMVNLGEVERVIGLSIGYTLILPWRFERFASRLESIEGRSIDRKKLRSDLELALQKIKTQKAASDSLLTGQGVANLDEGFGRLDALNRIGNQVFYINFLDPATGELPDPLLKGNFARNDAPVSFPPIWDTPYFLWAQYDASVLNELVRNSGEALGVSAKINMRASAPGRPLFESSIHLSDIARFEELLRGADPFSSGEASGRKFSGLVAPRWKDAQEKFRGDPAWAIDEKLVEKGRDLYRSHCFECHRGPVNDPAFDAKWPEDSFWKPENPDRAARNEKNWVEIGGRHYFNVVQLPLDAIGTDRQQSNVLTSRRVHLPASLGLNPIDDLNKAWGCGLPADRAADPLFVLALMDVVGKTVDQWNVANDSSEKAKQQMWGPRKNCQNPRVYARARVSRNGQDEEVLALEPHYRARPLDGVWATAPYLHNGSVPTLKDMLLPQSQRPTSFCVGSRKFDPVNVGLVTKTRSSDACAAGLTDFNVSLLGNSNRGHSFEGKETDITKLPPGVIGPELTDTERRALLEYLKTL
ncbi:di-heme-cytochrome C peroxidase [Bradyrhizobium sp. BEA-2-5]|uniref:di-heme-cytochrome C peroxidase n=1 Tax=Bradyrhizobium sp. BEA-2-5 TaxID=3080015 RepID=UPI00293E52E4|nr:di-heme-cytochrome C peroxidase [Bradyrhizobium sp. BEA-2-5]WOH80465.1 di-heme-cytochrome C peroxidase [Bradyrhizobium sp. BEA-2-5]